MDTIIRVEKNLDADPFARIDKVPINDEKLSFKAKGILTYVLSKPDGWEVNITDLTNHATDGRKAVRTGILELIELQYCRRIKLLDPVNKRIIKWVLIFYERPYSGEKIHLITKVLEPDTHNGIVGTEPDTPFPHLEKPHLEKGTVLTNELKEQKTLLTKEKRKSAATPLTLTGATKKNNGAAGLTKEKKQELDILKTNLNNIGWTGNKNEVLRAYNEAPNLVKAWLNYVTGRTDLRNPPGLLRQGIRTGKMPSAHKPGEKDRNYLEDPLAEFIEQ